MANTTSYSCVNVVSHLDPKFGGMSTSLPRFCHETGKADGRRVSLVGFCNPGEMPADVHRNVRVIDLPNGRLRWMFSDGLKRDLGRVFEQADTVHIHGLWEEHCRVSASLAGSLRKPYMISAHGMVEPWALRNKRVRKMLYATLVERPNLRGASCLRALTRAEVGHYRSFGVRTPVALIPNGVDPPANETPDGFLRRFPGLRDKRLVLFLGRIHHKKGLDILCSAWQRISSDLPDVHLVLAGPDFENTRPGLESFIEANGLSGRVTFTGMLSGEVKASALAAAEVFVLPSYSEGFSVAILEAMGAGLPVIITKQCHFPEVETNGCGRVIDPTAAALEIALRDLLNASESERARIGGNGKSLVERQYLWPRIAAQMNQVHSWIQGGPRPTDVEIFETS